MKSLHNTNPYTLVNAPPALVPQRIAKTHLFVGRKTSNTASVYEFLCGEERGDVYEFASSLADESKRVDFSPSIDHYLGEIRSSVINPPISDKRVEEGFKVGLVDYIRGALLKTDEGWADTNGDIVAPLSASLEDIRAIVSKESTLIPGYSQHDLISAENTGELFYGGNLVAKKQENHWIDLETQLKVRGDLVRFIHHQHRAFAIYSVRPSHTFYHGTVTVNPNPESNIEVRINSSRQGDAVYATSSLDEALNIYANPDSYESKGKNLASHTDKSLYGHIYKVSTSARILVATLDETFQTLDMIPSLASMKLLADYYGVSESYALMRWATMKDAKSSYDTYAEINAFSEAVLTAGGDNSTIPKLIGSMGFEGLEIEFPTRERLNSMKMAIEGLKKPSDLDSSAPLPAMINKSKQYVKRLEQSIPAKAQGRHLIVFRPTTVHKDHVRSTESAKEQDGDARRISAENTFCPGA